MAAGRAAGSFVFVTLNIIVVWILLLYLETSSAQTDRSCPLGRFCRLNANCTANTTFCVVQCPTESDLMQQGNHSTGNCESILNGTNHWMDSTFYEVFILSNQTVNTPIINIAFISTLNFRTNYNAVYNLPEDITFTLNGSCPYFYFTNMLKQEVAFENYYDYYVPDKIEQVSLALAEPVPPDDYEIHVAVTDGGSVLEQREIVIHVVNALPTLPPPRTLVEFESVKFVGSESAGSVIITLVLSGQRFSESFSVIVIAEVHDSTTYPAKAEADFTPGWYNATFGSGVVATNVSVPIMDDNINEEDEQFRLRLYIDGTGYGLGLEKGHNGMAVVSIISDNRTLSFHPLHYTIGEEEGKLEVTLILASKAPTNITVEVVSIDKSAIGGGIDYASGPYTVIIPVGATNVSFCISIINDALHEGDEKFFLAINSSSLNEEVTTYGQAIVTIVNDDSICVDFYQSSHNISEEHGFAQSVLVLSSPSSINFTIKIVNTNGSAHGGNDYIPGPDNITFYAGEINATYNITIVNDNILENSETFYLNLVSPPNNTKILISDIAQTAIHILDDDNITVYFTRQSYRISEYDTPSTLCEYNHSNSTMFPALAFTNPSSFTINVQVRFTDITATRGVDYISTRPTAQNVIFNPGIFIAPIHVLLINDDIMEANETFNLSIVNSDFRLFVFYDTSSNATVTILDDDPATISFKQSTYKVAEGSGPAQPVLILSNPSSANFTIQVTANETSASANGGTDFASGPYNVSFPSGKTEMSFDIMIIDDNMLEYNEDFMLILDTLTLRNVISEGNLIHTTITITNDDMVFVSFNQSTYSVYEDEGSVQLTLVLSNPSSYNITIRVISAANLNSTDTTTYATGGVDFDSGPYDVRFPAGNTNTSFIIPIIFDEIEENDETIVLFISPDLTSNSILYDSLNQANVRIFNINSIADRNAVSVGLIVGVSTGAVAAILVITIICCVIKKRKKSKSINFRSAKTLNLNELYNKHYGKAAAGSYTISGATLDEWKGRMKDFIIDYNALKIEETKAKGAFGIVYRGLYTKNNEIIEVAIKTLQDLSLSNAKEFIDECNMAKRFDHPNVLSLIGVCFIPEEATPLMIMPYMRQGDVKSFLKSKREHKIVVEKFPKGLSYHSVTQMCLDIAKGMEYLSMNHFIHRDLAARNCMLGHDMVVKVADFGLSRDIYATDYYKLMHSTPLPVKWLAPEALFDRIFTTKTDVWAFGITCWEIFTLGLQPYPSICASEISDYLKSGKVLDKPHLSSDKMYAMMKSCWSFTPEERPNFTLLVNIISQQLPTLKKQITKSASYLPIIS